MFTGHQIQHGGPPPAPWPELVLPPGRLWSLTGLTAAYLENDNSRQVDQLCLSWRGPMTLTAPRLQVNVREVERQIRLHLPNYDIQALTGSRDIPRSLVALLEDVLLINSSQVDQVSDSRVRRLGDDSWSMESRKGVSHPVHFREMSRDEGQWIESNLHYLRNFRPEVHHRLGIFLTGADIPLAYVCYYINDDDYIAGTAGRQLGRAGKVRVGHVARVYGATGLPANTMSLLYALSARHAFRAGAEYLTTAVNPYLGFHGRSITAAGFRPFAVSPVAYCFDRTGRYRTWRNRQGAHEGNWPAPHNILLIKGTSRTARKQVCAIGEPLVISRIQHDSV
jgi:hypothetical protein